MHKNIYPIAGKLLSRSYKEQFLGQKSLGIWLTGLSGSGKSTIAENVEKKLFNKGIFCQILDGDNLRTGINNGLGFDDNDRLENIRRASEVSKIFIDSGIVTINSFISPKNNMRELAKNIIGENNFSLIYINSPLKTCIKRDVKGLYAKAKKDNIKNFTGLGDTFEVPKNVDLEINTDLLCENQSTDMVLKFILEKMNIEEKN